MTNIDRKPRRDIYQEITDKIVVELEKGACPWHRPWKSSNFEGRAFLPLRHNGIAYRGVNVLSLWMAARREQLSIPRLADVPASARTRRCRLQRARRELSCHQAADQSYLEDGIRLLDLAVRAREVLEKRSAIEKRMLLK